MDGRRYSGGLSTSQAASQVNATRTMQIITRKAVFSGAGHHGYFGLCLLAGN